MKHVWVCTACAGVFYAANACWGHAATCQRPDGRREQFKIVRLDENENRLPDVVEEAAVQ